MIEKTILLTSLFFFLAVPFQAFSQKDVSPDFQAILKQNLNSAETKEIFEDSFGVADVNNDAFVSENEFSYITKAVDYEYNLNAAEKTAKKARLTKLFSEVDKNRNGRLEKNEYMNFMKEETEFEAVSHMGALQKIRGDVGASFDSVEKAEQKLQAALDDLEAVTDKLKKVEQKQISNQLADNMMRNIVGEYYFQMDKDKNNCVTEKEYVSYMAAHSGKQNKTASEGMNMTPEEYAILYKQEKKADTACLTKEEYVKNSLNEISSLEGGISD